MRKIKFRAWFKNENEMKEVAINNVYEGNGTYLHLSPLPFGDYKVIELMQYTGLKDKNGKEIYEGDIVKGKNYGFNNPIRYIGTVEYSYNKFKVIGCRNKYKGTNDELSTIYEVIGNIYENPELLAGEQNE